MLTVALLGTGAGMHFHAQAANRENAIQAENVKDNNLAGADDETKEAALSQMLKRQVSGSERQVGKEETVYVVADASGKTKNVIVSEWLKNPDGKAELADATDLKDVKNVKGNETFAEGKDGSINWQAE